jgi:hypothetical protein
MEINITGDIRDLWSIVKVCGYRRRVYLRILRKCKLSIIRSLLKYHFLLWRSLCYFCVWISIRRWLICPRAFRFLNTWLAWVLIHSLQHGLQWRRASLMGYRFRRRSSCLLFPLFLQLWSIDLIRSSPWKGLIIRWRLSWWRLILFEFKSLSNYQSM